MKRILLVLVCLSPFSGVLVAQSLDPNLPPIATEPQPLSGEIVAKTWTTLRWEPGAAAAMHKLYISEDFNDVNDGTVEPVLTADASQVVGSAGTPIPAGLVSNVTYYWRVDEVNDAHPDSPWPGEVWEFTIAPRTAWGPVPEDMGLLLVGARTPKLTWSAGLGALIHYWYFGETFEDVNAPPVATGTAIQATSIEPPITLDPNNTYYWRVDEYDNVTRGFHRGAVWSFRAAAWVVVDNFEQYTDEDPNWLWLYWQDGYEANATGAIVGYLAGHEMPYTYETVIARPGSAKSMPLFYDNSGEPDYPVFDESGNPTDYGTRLMYSEAALPLNPVMNWSRYGNLPITTLMLWYRGNEDNALENVYIVIKDSTNRQVAVPVQSDLLQSTKWNVWSIDLRAEVADQIDLTRVSSLGIRIGEPDSTVPGGAGLLYIDDIGLVAE